MKSYVAIENHPNDSRLRMRQDGICQTLSSRMGTGGNNEPMVLEITGTQGELEIYTTNKARHFVGASKDIAFSLVATDYKDAPIIAVKEQK